MQETPPLSISLGFIFYNSEQLLYVMCQELQNVPSSSVINRNKSKSSLLGRAVCYFAYQYFKESNVYCNPASLCSHCGGFRSTSTLDCHGINREDSLQLTSVNMLHLKLFTLSGLRENSQP